MAADDALARTLVEGEAVLRLYGWSRPTVSFGRNEAARGRYRRRAADEAGIVFVRRPTGGRSVLHHRELTYAVALPLPRRGLRTVYRAVHEAVAEGLRSMGLAARLATGAGPALRPDAGACFEAAAGGEVLLGGRKVVGSAQARVGGSLLQHGSVLLAAGQERLEGLRRPETGAVARSANGRSAVGGPDPVSGSEPTAHLAAARPAPIAAGSLAEALGRMPAAEEVARALTYGFRVRFGGEWRVAEWDAGTLDLAQRLLDRYRSGEWTWRR